MKKRLKLIVMDNCKELGEKVNKCLSEITGENHIISITNSRFTNGEGKITLNETVRGSEVYILSDVFNYNISYKMHGNTHYMGPDEHFQDIKRAISAVGGLASKVVVIMPFLYGARQHRKKGRESLDCAMSLQELERLGVDSIITFDAHDPNVANAIPMTPFENLYATHTILESIIENDRQEIDNMLVISPDFGAMSRAGYYADMVGSDVGVFYKRRDLTKVVNGVNPIVAHAYMGADIEDKNIIIVDDMIATGGSILEVCEEIRKKNPKSINIVTTFAMFTAGIEIFDEAYKKGFFDRVYATNLTYVKEEIKESPWYISVDCSKQLSTIINTMFNNESMAHLFNGKKETINKIIKAKKEASKK